MIIWEHLNDLRENLIDLESLQQDHVEELKDEPLHEQVWLYNNTSFEYQYSNANERAVLNVLKVNKMWCNIGFQHMLLELRFSDKWQNKKFPWWRLLSWKSSRTTMAELIGLWFGRRLRQLDKGARDLWHDYVLFLDSQWYY